MSFTISTEKLREVFPAFLLTDRSGRILDFGPAIARHLPSVRIGDPMEAHFSANGEAVTGTWDELAREPGRPLELQALGNGPILTGAIIPDAGRYLLAMNPATASLAMANSTGDGSQPALHISDFTAGDPAVDVMLLVRMQQAMLEDAGTLATSLERERLRNEGLVDRVSRLAGFLAHDFNNILSIIRLNAERLAALDPAGSQHKRLASIIAETAERGSGITRSFMTISRGNTEQPAPHSADELIGQHLGFFSAVAGPDIMVSANLRAPAGLIHVATGDFLNCLTNLVLNARDAIVSPGAIEIATSLLPSCASRPSGSLEITVCDTGVGMTEDVLHKAFEPFFSTKKKGNGIGLPAVADYLRECGGEVRLDSAPGSGTQVSLGFPLVVPDSQPDASGIADVTSGAAGHLPEVKPEAHTVLLVEDEPYALEALVEMLELEGFEVWPASSAEEATERLEAEEALSRTPSILLTDVILPRKTGIDLARAAVSRTPDLKVILMSGFVPADHTIESDWFFAPKPLNSEKLLQMLRG